MEDGAQNKKKERNAGLAIEKIEPLITNKGQNLDKWLREEDRRIATQPIPGAYLGARLCGPPAPHGLQNF